MRKSVTCAAVVLFAATSGLAWADTKTLARAGSWEAFGGTTTKGQGVCGISVSYTHLTLPTNREV